jgi:thiamine transport system ATP-binding protein
LLDEPLTGLDQDTHATLMHDVIRVLKETATTALLVTHNASEAQTMAYRILPMTAT